MTIPVIPDSSQLEPRRARRLLRLSWALALLVLIAIWGSLIEGLHQRQTLLREQQQTRQAQWLRLAGNASDQRLKNLHKELQLFTERGPSLARDASELSPLGGGKLWRVDADGSVTQLRGQPGALPDSAVQSMRQWLNNDPEQQSLSLLPGPQIGNEKNSDLLQVLLPQCDNDQCHSAVTGFLHLHDLLDPEQIVEHPAYALLDISGNIIASSGHPGFDDSRIIQFARTRLSQVPMQLAVQYHSSETVRSFNLFSIGLTAIALTLSMLILLLMFRVSQILRHIETNNNQLAHARQLLALTNNSLREKMRKLIDEQRDQQTLIETVQVGVMIVDAGDLSVLTSNDAAARMIGMSRQMLQRQTLPALFSTPQRCQELLDVLREQQIVTDREAQLNNHNEKTCWSMTSMRYLKFRERNAIAISLIDITERIAHAQRLQDEKQATERALAQLQATQHELYQRATLDDLTGLANRRHFLSFAGKALERARLDGDAVAVALIDLDHFKRINDNHGHAAGDAALQHFAGKLRSMLPDNAMAGRMGGEEFALLLPTCDLEQACATVNQLREAVASHYFDAEGTALQLTFSAGVTAHRHGDEHDLSSLLKLADKALYQAKDNGRNRVESIAV